MKKLFLKILLLICWVQNSTAQDVHFSQYFTMPLFTNPAYVGIHQQSKVGLIYRNQYNSMPSSYTTYGVCYDAFAPSIHGGFGIKLIKDDVGNGILQNQQIGASYAYHNYLSKKLAFSFGMEALCNFNIINTSKIVTYNMLSQQTGDVIAALQNVENINFPTSKVFFDVNSGALIFNDNFYAGLGVAHLAKPNDGWSQTNVIPNLFNFETGYLFHTKNRFKTKDESWYFSPNLYYLHQANMSEINITALAGLGYAQAGLGYRNASNADAIIFHLAFLNSTFRIGYSFDFNVSTKYYQPRNAHEISIQYIIERQKKSYNENDWGINETISKGKRIKCPNFFR